MKKKFIQIEVVDRNNRPFTHMDINEVHRQSLRHRSVIILVYDNEGKLFLQKRGSQHKLYTGRWDVSASTHVQSGESCENAAMRTLEHQLGITAQHLKLIENIEASSETGYEFISLFVLDKLNAILEPNPDEIDSGYFYSESELNWLIKEYRELMVPAMVFLHERGMLFKFK